MTAGCQSDERRRRAHAGALEETRDVVAAGRLEVSYVLAIDQGTTSTRAILFSSELTIVAAAQQEFAQHYPAPGWVEHDPEDIWRTTLATGREALASAGARAAELAAIGIANQRETTLIWDRKTGEPIHRAIVWQDRRTAGACEQLRAAGHEPLVSARTGLLLDPYFSATKIAWLLDNVAGARARAERGELAFGTVDTFLLWRLTGGAVHATDATNASRTLLYDIRRNAWDDELLALFRVPRAILPEVRDSADDFGFAQARAFRRQDRDPRRRRRPAGGDRRPGLFRAGHDEGDLRHRRLRAGQHRQDAGRLVASPADDHRLPARAARRPMRSKARSSSPARRCNGCATGSA